jgi:hypothetical protein
VTEPREAFDAIRQAIARDPRKELVDSRYEEKVFGNFIIAFRDEGQPRSIVNDRFELVVCDNLEGDDCRTILRSIREADEGTILQVLGL